MPCHVRKRNSRNMPLAAHRHVVDVASAGGEPERRAANPTKQTGKLNRMSRLAVPTPQLETRKPRNTLPGFAHCVATPLYHCFQPWLKFDRRLALQLFRLEIRCPIKLHGPARCGILS